jgi:hypothetical protein
MLKRWAVVFLRKCGQIGDGAAPYAAPDDADAPAEAAAVPDEDESVEALAAAGFEPESAATLSDFAASAPEFSVAVVVDLPPLLPPRKSVTYQPEPFN